jgi:hypothetical protein
VTELKPLADNTGIYMHNVAPAGDCASVLVCGLGRSGTTMVSRALSSLGLHMGDKLSARSHEDRQFQSAVKRHRFEEFETLCRDRDARFDRWGFKAPSARQKLEELVILMRNPRIIITSRDPLAISLRSSSETGEDLFKVLNSTLRKMNALARKLDTLNCPVMLISYEKAVLRPDDLVAALNDYCGLGACADVLANAREVVQPAHPLYTHLLKLWAFLPMVGVAASATDYAQELCINVA